MTQNARSETSENTKCGFVAVIGAPNAGKSTLVNLFVGGKVSIVTHKVQTTRTRIRGIALADDTQLVFVDTPGIFKPRRRLDRAMVAAAWDEAADADVVCLLVDAQKGVCHNTQAIVDGLVKDRRKAVLVLNKIDLVARESLLELVVKLNESGTFTDTFMISATKDDGTKELFSFLKGAMPQGPWLFSPEQLSDMPDHLLAAEITREKLYVQLQQELPYAITVETERYIENEKGHLVIDQTIYVQRSSQKKIVLGKGGNKIKAIGKAARYELEELLGCKVHLYLFVKVRERWVDDPERYRDWGLDFNA